MQIHYLLILSLQMQDLCAHTCPWKPKSQTEAEHLMHISYTVFLKYWMGWKLCYPNWCKRVWMLFSILIWTGVWSKPQVTKSSPGVLPSPEWPQGCSLEIGTCGRAALTCTESAPFSTKASHRRDSACPENCPRPLGCLACGGDLAWPTLPRHQSPGLQRNPNDPLKLRLQSLGLLGVLVASTMPTCRCQASAPPVSDGSNHWGSALSLAAAWCCRLGEIP